MVQATLVNVHLWQMTCELRLALRLHSGARINLARQNGYRHPCLVESIYLNSSPGMEECSEKSFLIDGVNWPSSCMIIETWLHLKEKPGIAAEKNTLVGDEKAKPCLSV